VELPDKHKLDLGKETYSVPEMHFLENVTVMLIVVGTQLQGAAVPNLPVLREVRTGTPKGTVRKHSSCGRWVSLPELPRTSPKVADGLRCFRVCQQTEGLHHARPRIKIRSVIY